MIRHQDIWKRAKDEIKVAMTEGRCRDRVVTYDDARKLPFLEACVYESVRMFGPGPFQLSRVAPKQGINIGPNHFPAGTVLSINPQLVDTIWRPSTHPSRSLPTPPELYLEIS